jgi:mono/diheme cytochrome c family protein
MTIATRASRALVMAVVALWSVVAHADPPASRRGRRDYERHCVWCHGEYGDGRGPSHEHFTPAPRDFTSAAFKCRSTPSGALPTDEDLRRSIEMGVHGTGMPSWASLGPLQVDDLIAWIKHFSPRWRTERAPPPIAIPAEPPRTHQSVRRGAAVYRRMRCATCHGAGGRGVGLATPNLRDEAGNAIRAADLRQAGSLRCGDEPERIYATFMTGLNGTPMPSFADSLAPADAWDLTHYILSLRH